MSHLSEEQLIEHVIDGAELSTDQHTHLATCAACRNRLQAIMRMARELQVARRSQPSPAALERYERLFDQVVQRPDASPARVWANLLGRLTWDGREQTALAGLRSAHVRSYRLLYTTERADVELLIEPTNGHRHLEGEILVLDETVPFTPALVQLQDAASHRVQHETESNAAGRFGLDAISPAVYQLLITPRQGALVQINELTIT